MEAKGKEIRKILAKWTNGDPFRPEWRTVEIQSVEDGKAFVQPTDFNPWSDDVIYYNGWITDIGNLREVHFQYTDGTREYMGDPPVNKRPVYLVAEIRTNVL